MTLLLIMAEHRKAGLRKAENTRTPKACPITFGLN